MLKCSILSLASNSSLTAKAALPLFKLVNTDLAMQEGCVLPCNVKLLT